MEQIAVIAWRFKLLPSDPMPSFEATYFINSDGTFSANDKWFTANNAHISQWDYMTNKEGKKLVNFYCGGESFTITDDEQSSIATPFFEKHLKSLYRK
jgi:hypothetical protein